MEPPVRLYNSNGAGGPRKRAARTSKRTATAESRPAARAVRTSTPPPAVATPAVDPIVADPAPAVESAQQSDAGPVVGISDFEEIFTRFQTPITNFVFRLVGNREQAAHYLHLAMSNSAKNPAVAAEARKVLGDMGAM